MSRTGEDGTGSTPLDCRKEDFSLPEGLRYLNCAYMSPLPRATEDAVVTGLRRKRDPSGIRPEAFFEDTEEVRRRFGRIVSGSPDRVAILPSASYGIAVCARNLLVGRGEEIVLTHEQFPGNVYAWWRVAAEAGARVVTVGPDGPVAAPSATPVGAEDEGGGRKGSSGDGRSGGGAGVAGETGRGERWNHHLLEAIGESTALVALPHVHWTDGTRFDLDALCRRARQVGAAVVVDATQSLGALPLDVGTLRPDAVVAATYKWLFGPYGMALAWFGERLDGGVPLEETWMGREGSEDFQHLVDYRDAYQPGARRYDVGEVASFALLPGVKASLGLVLEWGPERIRRYCAELTTPLVEHARGLGFEVESLPYRSEHLFGIRMRPDVELSELKAELDRRRIVASLRGTALRISPNVYNTVDDVEALAEALASV